MASTLWETTAWDARITVLLAATRLYVSLVLLHWCLLQAYALHRVPLMLHTSSMRLASPVLKSSTTAFCVLRP